MPWQLEAFLQILEILGIMTVSFAGIISLEILIIHIYWKIKDKHDN